MLKYVLVFPIMHLLCSWSWLKQIIRVWGYLCPCVPYRFEGPVQEESLWQRVGQLLRWVQETLHVIAYTIEECHHQRFDCQDRWVATEPCDGKIQDPADIVFYKHQIQQVGDRGCDWRSCLHYGGWIFQLAGSCSKGSSDGTPRGRCSVILISKECDEQRGPASHWQDPHC